jgi:two-component system, chemotaxis family, CheB/CheR fusion protein
MDDKAESEISPRELPLAGSESASPEDLIAVGIGASAGGLEASTELLRHLPPATGMAFILVQHLDPHHDSALPELLAAKTKMPVVQVHSETQILPDHVYVVPPNSLMHVDNRLLVLEAMPATPERFRPIDAFFYSLAEEFRFNSVGIVLSGTASDGTLGLKAIKAEGGITFAQNQTAKFDSMPRSAIAAGVVDFVLPPRRIAEELAAIARRKPNLNRMEDVLRGDRGTLDRVLLLLRRNTGVDFTQYKQPTVLRRLNRRMVVRKTESLEQYYALLQEEPEEAKALFDDLLINVTDFFRDPEAFESAKKTMFPAIIRDRKQPLSIRAWVPGCSSGEEVYSMAIALVEFLESEDLDCTIQMFGSDISDTAIDKARAGVYGEGAMASVSPERQRRFFVRTETGYQISRAIREMCIFSRHNLAKDPPLSRMDLISCQNVLIYFSPSLQRRIIATLGYALQPGGCLILGPSETLGSLSDHFLTLDERHKIYCRKANTATDLYTLFAGGNENGPGLSRPTARPRPAEVPKTEGRLHRYVNQVVLSRFGPAGVVVDERLHITDYRGDAAPYLAPDAPSNADLMEVVRAELRAPLSTAIEQARRTRVTVVAENSGGPAGDRSAAITVVPLTLAGMAQHFLILFGRPGEEDGLDEIPAPLLGEVETAAAGSLSPEQDNARLRQELKATREYLQAVIEELRSANEEAQSSNEELQSTNEEMQTSKEELQSANEELNTINAEMQSRNADLAQLNNDLVNLLASMNMPIVMTGIDLRIRRFTPMAEKVLRLISTDISRPIADLKPRINVPNLEAVLQHVLDTLQPHEEEVQDQEGRLYLMRVRPYRTSDNRIDGTVLQLLDVSELRRSLEEVKHARDYAEAIVNTVREPLAVLDQNLAIQNANRSFYDALEVNQAAALRQSIFQVGSGRFDQPKVRSLFQQLSGGFEQLNDIEIDYRTERGETRTVTLNARRLRTPENKQLILMVFEDVTERKREAEARYRRLFESARDGIVLVDSETAEIVDLNPFTEGLLGYSRDDLVGGKLWEIEPMRNLPKLRAAFDQIRDQGVVRFEALTLRTKDGRDVQVEVIANSYSEGDRRLIQFNMRDVGERKKFERELQETQKLEGLGLLAGGIAHDFNNLLTGIIGNASLAYADLPPDAPTRIRLREVVQAGERAAFLTRQMLAYAGRGRFVTERIDLGAFVSDISALLRTSIPKSVELRLDLAPDLPAIEADPAQIQQVVMNLVINGAEAIGGNATGKVEIRTSLRKVSAREASEVFRPEQPAPGTYVQLEVTDTGSGMDEATKARIFDPFFTTKFTGRGLGLAAVQGIVKGHGGAIRVYSSPGHGTTFHVLLPARQAKAAVARRPKRDSAPIPSGSLALVIDDEEIVRSLADKALSRAGMKVLTAENGKAGVEVFREHSASISVVVLDLQMPVMGGEEALAELKQIRPEVPVILSSGFDESEAERRFTGLKPAFFLQKPYTVERLVEAVAATLKASR